MSEAPPEPSPATLPYGAWPSPITAADVASAQQLVSFPLVRGQHVWWQERLPAEGGRTTVAHRGPDGRVRSLLSAPWDARTRVHEYGGLSYLPVPAPAPGGAGGHAVVFANHADQRLYLLGPGESEPRPLTPESGGPPHPALRFADFALSPDGREVWCVREQHSDGKAARAIVAVPLDGSASGDAARIRQIAAGSDFFAFPTPSPDGSRLAWICWNHPRMPWDGTELRVAPIENGVAGRSRLIKGGMRESVLAPLWRDNQRIYVVTDWPGWWNLYELDLGGWPPQALHPAEEEFGLPLWQLGQRPFALLGDGRLAVLHGRASMTLGILDPETGDMTEAETGFPLASGGLAADGMTVAVLAGGPADPVSLVRLDVAAGRAEVLEREQMRLPDRAYLPAPREIALEGRFGRTVHVLVHPPANPEAKAPDGERPPYVVWAHGGPTSHATSLLDIEKAYFTSRGIGVVDVNYGGSTGYGRSYRERLRREWGIVDVEDVVAAAQALAQAGEADPARLGIRGGSAGGWTALAAVTTHAAANGPVFGAATAYYGVADLREFAEQTHDFESRYLDGLVGPLPGYEAVYAERSPAGHVTKATCPILLLQGLDDPIVPPAQARAIAAGLAANGIRHALLEFEGESHGFRRAETIIACLEAELSFYGLIFGFTPPGVPGLRLTTQPAVSARTRSPGTPGRR